LKDHRLTARQDSSNLDMTLTRNRLRHDLLPLLAKQFQSDIIAVLGRLARQASDVYGIFEEQARRLLVAAEKPSAGDILVLDLASLAARPRPLVREALHVLWEREGWPCDAMPFEMWERLVDIVIGNETAVDLPGTLRAQRKGKVLQIGRKLR